MSGYQFSLSRFGRLCLKELRESLRDRRTVITLVLMPLLIYPLLSLVLNRVLLNSISAKASQTVTIGVSSEVRSSPLPDFLIGRLAIVIRSRSFAGVRRTDIDGFVKAELKSSEEC